METREKIHKKPNRKGAEVAKGRKENQRLFAHKPGLLNFWNGRGYS